MGSQERRQAHPQTMVDRVASQQTADFVGGPQNNAFLLSIQGNLNNRLTFVCIKVRTGFFYQDSGKTIHSAEENDTSYQRAAFFTEMKQKKNFNGRLKTTSFSSSPNSQYFL